MANFDQRNQKVKYQNNVVGDINFGMVQNSAGLILELEKLQKEIRLALSLGNLNADKAEKIDEKLQQVISQTKSTVPNKINILEHLKEAQEIIAGVTSATGLLKMLMEAAEIVRRLF